jgi:hypothetical protein
MARLVQGTHCPHCNAELPTPKPITCPECAGSLRQRHLKAGCLSSAPKLVLFATAAWWLARELSREWS